MDAWSKQQMKQNEIKLDILQSLARSQKALARIMESLSDVVGSSDKISEELLGNMAVISGYQKMLADRIAEIHLPKKKKCGNPANPWMHPRLKQGKH
ncbi:MAG TPA: hypothetical protein VGE40_08600 [Bacilli bacterium]